MWSLDGTKAQLACPSLRARLDVGRPEDGLSEIAVALDQRTLLPVPLLRWFALRGATDRLADSYVRGNDLVATYGESNDDRLTRQIYWRLLRWPEFAAVGLELIVSAQTEGWESDPSSEVGSTLEADEIQGWTEDRWQRVDGMGPASPREAASMVLFRWVGSALSYAEMVHPSDRHRTTLRRVSGPEGPVRCGFELFPERLEKGVIRRGRLCGLWLPREDDRSVALAAFRRFTMAAPPLTA